MFQTILSKHIKADYTFSIWSMLCGRVDGLSSIRNCRYLSEPDTGQLISAPCTVISFISGQFPINKQRQHQRSNASEV